MRASLIVLSFLLMTAGCSHVHAATPPVSSQQQPAQPTQPAQPAQAASAIAPVKGTPALAAPMSRLQFLRGVWVGKASGTDRSGQRYSVTQTERIGPLLGGDVMVIEGRGYLDDGTTGFNALGIISWNPRTRKYEFRSYAQGHAGTFDLTLTDEGYTWEVPAGPGAVMRFTATVQGDTYREVGEYIATGKTPVPNFEMNLRRRGDTDWPLGTPVTP